MIREVKTDYDAVVVGSGPNGFGAAITLQQAGCTVLVIEGKSTIGGGLRSGELTLPGFTHDICSAIHPMAAASPLFRQLPLHEHGLEFIYPQYAAAHPFDDGSAAILQQSLDATASSLGIDQEKYQNYFEPIIKNWDSLAPALLGPLRIPSDPIALSRFGLNALKSAEEIARGFKTEKARGLWGGMAAHSILSLDKLSTAAIGFVLMAVGHVHGWPMPKGGSQQLTNALASYFMSLGGKIQTGLYVKTLRDLPSAKAILFDITPRQLLEIAGHSFSSIYKWQLQRYRYGMGVFKMDWAIDGAVPWTNPDVAKAGTVHLGNTFKEIALSEKTASTGGHSERPYVLLAQQSLFDKTRAPEGKHAVWAYCHVPHGSTVDMSRQIENQIERFAPGFRDRILAKHVMNTSDMHSYNSNYIGGDISGGVIDLGQLFTRPALRWSPYRTSAKGLYICSSSTPPGGGVHGMCGYHAARRALKDIFDRKPVYQF